MAFVSFYQKNKKSVIYFTTAKFKNVLMMRIITAKGDGERQE